MGDDRMTTREHVLKLVERTDDEDLRALVPVLERLARPLSAASLKAMAEAAPVDDEPSTEAELQGEAEYEAWLRGEERGIPDEDVRDNIQKRAA